MLSQLLCTVVVLQTAFAYGDDVEYSTELSVSSEEDPVVFPEDVQNTTDLTLTFYNALDVPNRCRSGYANFNGNCIKTINLSVNDKD